MKKIYSYTLVELIVAMSVFTIVMLMLVQLFNSAQKVWSASEKTNRIYSDARVAMDLITRDLEGTLLNYEESPRGVYPFWFQSDSRINFIAETPIKSSGAESSICEIRYALGDGTNNVTYDGTSAKIVSKGTLVRSCTSDDGFAFSATEKYNYMAYPVKTRTGTTYTASQRADYIWDQLESGAGNSYNDFEDVIENVVELKFTCFKNNSGTLATISPNGSDICDSSNIPYMIKIDLTLLDQSTWEKCVLLGQDPTNTTVDLVKENMRTFSKTVFLGGRQ